MEMLAQTNDCGLVLVPFLYPIAVSSFVTAVTIALAPQTIKRSAALKGSPPRALVNFPEVIKCGMRPMN